MNQGHGPRGDPPDAVQYSGSITTAPPGRHMVQYGSMILELTAGQQAFQQQVAAFAAERIAPAAAAIDADGRYPRELVGEMATRGLLGVTIAPEWGGSGHDYVSYALALEA